jgi:hypothetical protein
MSIPLVCLLRTSHEIVAKSSQFRVQASHRYDRDSNCNLVFIFGVDEPDIALALWALSNVPVA